MALLLRTHAVVIKFRFVSTFFRRSQGEEQLWFDHVELVELVVAITGDARAWQCQQLH